MKITIEIGDVVCAVEDKGAISLSEAIGLFNQALKGSGFYFTGELDIVESEE